MVAVCVIYEGLPHAVGCSANRYLQCLVMPDWGAVAEYIDRFLSRVYIVDIVPQ